MGMRDQLRVTLSVCTRERASLRVLLLLVIVGAGACGEATRAVSVNAVALPAIGSAREFAAFASPERRGIGMRRLVPDPAIPKLDLWRSLAVTNTRVLEAFAFQDVMEALACPEPTSCPAGERPRRALALFQQWWGTQKEPECRTVAGGYACPRPEGQLASEDPFAKDAGDAAFIPLGLFNRIDLADHKGADCGEYRMVFARVSGRSGTDDTARRLLVNFEAVLPNPAPGPAPSLAGCMPIARFWSDLSAVDDVDEVARRLRAFYFEGRFPDGSALPWPVVHADNYGGRCAPENAACPTGRIRTNQRMALPWVLREFRLVRATAGDGMTSRFEPARVGDTPDGMLFGQARMTPAFKQAFLERVPLLLRPGLNDFCYGASEDSGCSGFPRALDRGESTAAVQGDSDYVHHFGSAEADFLADIQRRLRPPVDLPGELIARAQVLSCAGCHQLSQDHRLGGFLRWPTKSLPFVHVTERQTTGSGAEQRYVVSEVTEMFLQHRERVLRALLERP